MAKTDPVSCPRCSGTVEIFASGGGRGTRDLTHYSANCDHCGLLVDHLSANGRKDSAIRDYNRWATGQKAILAGLAPPKRTAQAMPVEVVQTRSDFARGYFCAVSVLLREVGSVSTFVQSLFSQGGDPTLADPCDIELFCKHGLMVPPE